MNKALLIFDNKLRESVIFLMQLKGFWPGCILLHILNMQTCCSKKIWIECCTSLVKTTIKLLADINSTAFAICCLTTIVELVRTVHTVPEGKLNTIIILISRQLAIMSAFLWNPHEMAQSSLMWPWPVRMVSCKRLTRWCRLWLIPLNNENKHSHPSIWAGGFALPPKQRSCWNLFKKI